MENKVAVVGEAWGEHEEREQTPFVGPSGYELSKMLSEAGLHRADCFLTNVFQLRPRGNDIGTLCGPKTNSIPGYPYLVKGKYVSAEYGGQLSRLAAELDRVNPNIIIALGNTALWALLGATGISKLRGTVAASTHTISGFKVLPTYHPAAILRQWDLRAVTVLDLMKAARESEFPEVIRPQREVWIEPDLRDMERFYGEHIIPCEKLSVDIETAGTQITCIGFAPSPQIALVIPFVDQRRARGSYWPNRGDELAAWSFVRRVLDDPCPKIFQNGLYDISFLWRSYRIKVRNPAEDTMLLSHALQPESPKALAFLGSVFTNEASWKLMNRRGQTIKGDDE